MRTFVEVRKILFRGIDLKEQVRQLKEHSSEHALHLNQIYDALGTYRMIPLLKENGVNGKELDLRKNVNF